MTRPATLTALALAALLSRALGFGWWQIVTGLLATGVAVGLVAGVCAGRVVRAAEENSEW